MPRRGQRGAAGGEPAAAAQLGRPTAQGKIGGATAELLRPGDKPGRWRASHPRVLPGEPPQARGSCKCPFVPKSRWTLSPSSPIAQHTPRRLRTRSRHEEATKARDG